MKYRECTEDDGSIGREYDHDYIAANPIPARCAKCKHHWVDGPQRVMGWVGGKWAKKVMFCRDAIRAPSLANCRCFYCGGELKPLERGGPSTVEEVERGKMQPSLALEA